MKFPNLVYKCPGVHQCPGGTFSYLSVKSEAELNAAFEAGWSSTLLIACGEEEPIKEAKTATEGTKPDDAPPTRAEILKACDDLNIPYKKNTPSKKLLELIDKQLK